MQDSIQLPAQRGKQAEKYRKIKVLGEGSMGKAYLVQCAEDNQLYVMKRINLGNLGPKQHESALRQAQLHSTLNHPHIIQFKELYQTTGDKLCIVMQYAQGGDLERLIEAQNGKLMSEQTVLSILVQICFGLQEVHSKRIIHRDLKPTNIFLSKNNDVKIGDFGISRALDHTQLAATAMIGTPYYLSPEMVEGKPYSTKADIWALGVILYQLCSFKLPFDANSLPVLALKILKGSFPPIPNNYSKDMKSLVLQMLQVDQKKRPSIEAILMKPFIFKLLSKEEQLKLTSRQQQKQQLRKDKQKLKKEEKMEKVQKAEKGEKDMKEKARKQKQDKRQEMRKQMREDLKKKRAGKQKQYESAKSPYPTKIISPEVPHELKKSPHKEVQNVFKPEPIEKIKKQEPVKPWKNKKPGQKKDFTIQMYVPEQKPKQPKEEQSSQDFKVEIFVSKKPDQKQPPPVPIGPIKQQGRKSMPIIGQQIQNYHYQSKNQDQNEQNEHPYDQDFQEEEIQQEDQLHQLMRNVQELSKMFPKSKDIDLYEESENFDSTLQAPPQIAHDQKLSNLKQLLSSQTLQQLREVLQQKLGDSKFIQTYTIVKKHLDEYLQGIDKQELSKKDVKDGYLYNKQLLMAKLPFLTQKQFNETIDWLFTLLIYEEMEMQNCNSEMGESKYERLL